MSNSRILFAILGVALISGLPAGCSGGEPRQSSVVVKGELTPDKAKILVEGSNFGKANWAPVGFGAQDLQCAIHSGFFTTSGTRVIPTAEGQKYFKYVSGGTQLVMGGTIAVQAHLIAPMKREVVQVREIRDIPNAAGETYKGISFTWRYDWSEVPTKVKSCLAGTIANAGLVQGHANAKLRDDGWHIE